MTRKYPDLAPPRSWRGITITTPFFAAVDFESHHKACAEITTNGAAGDSSNPRIMLDALKHCGIRGWTSNIRCK